MPTTTNWTESARLAAHAVTQAVTEANSILIVTHVGPDGDAIGSMLGLLNVLRQIGKQPTCAVDEGVPDYLEFLPGSADVLGKLTHGQWDLMISVDASDEARTGEAGQYGREHAARVINIDHHATNTQFGDIQLVIPTAVSTTEVLFGWLSLANLALPQEAAVALLCGLVTDTLGFRTSNVTATTLLIGQQLMEAGASLAQITARTLDNRDFQVVSLWKNALASVELYEGGVIIAVVTQADLKQAGLLEPTDGGLVQFLIKINQARIAAVLKETAEGKIDLSLRSKLGFDVSGVALALGGGGHQQAAGTTMDGPPDAARKRLLPLLIKAARQGKLTLV